MNGFSPRITSCVAVLSACASSEGLTARTTAREGSFAEMPPARSPATRMPSCVPVASRMMTCERSGDGLVRLEITIGTMTITPKKSGPSAVLKMYHFERTRSRYSRLMIAKSLPMTAHPRLDAGCANRVEEDAMQRRLDELEALDSRAGVHEPAQQELRARAGGELELHGAVGVV